MTRPLHKNRVVWLLFMPVVYMLACQDPNVRSLHPRLQERLQYVDLPKQTWPTYAVLEKNLWE